MGHAVARAEGVNTRCNIGDKNRAGRQYRVNEHRSNSISK